MNLIKISQEIADKIVILRKLKDEDEGYQRKLSQKKVSGTIEYAKTGMPVPPIALIKKNGGYECLDGQHRLEAWKKYNFPLMAHIMDLGGKDPAEVFCKINTTHTRVPLSHRLRVDPTEAFRRVREIAGELKIKPHDVYSTGMGIANNYGSRMDKVQWALARRILKSWVADSRWNNPMQWYSKAGTLMAVAHLAKNSTDIDRTVTILKKMDYSKNGPFAIIYGASSKAQSLMRDKMARFLAKHI